MAARFSPAGDFWGLFPAPDLPVTEGVYNNDVSLEPEFPILTFSFAKNMHLPPRVSSKIERACFGVAARLVLTLPRTSVIGSPPFHLPHCQHLSPLEDFGAFDSGVSAGSLAVR